MERLSDELCKRASLEMARRGGMVDNFVEDLAGAAFPELAYPYLREHNEGLEILNPNETLEYYASLLYPNGEIIGTPDLLQRKTMKGITVPGGIAFKDGVITQTYYYSSRKNIVDAARLVGMSAIDTENNPEFFKPHIDINFVTLKGSCVELRTKNVFHISIDLNHEEFRALIDEVINEIRPVPVAAK